MMVRGPDLAESMSRYLIDRIAATSNIELMTQTEIVALDGPAGGGLEKVRWRDRRAGEGVRGPDPQCLFVRRRGSGDRMAARLRRGAG